MISSRFRPTIAGGSPAVLEPSKASGCHRGACPTDGFAILGWVMAGKRQLNRLCLPVCLECHGFDIIYPRDEAWIGRDSDQLSENIATRTGFTSSFLEGGQWLAA
jgi:hypothetical protein